MEALLHSKFCLLAKYLYNFFSILKLHTQDPEQLINYNSDLLPILLLAEKNSKIFKKITSILWNYLGESDLDSSQIVSLLYQLHNLLNDSLVEEVIGKEISRNKNYCIYENKQFSDCDISYKRNSHYIEMFKKFELLWKFEENRQKGFASILMIFLDIVSFPNNEPFKDVMLKWLHDVIIHGDIEKIMQPFLNILLSLETSRVTIADYSNVSEMVTIETENKQHLKKNNMVILYRI